MSFKTESYLTKQIGWWIVTKVFPSKNLNSVSKKAMIFKIDGMTTEVRIHKRVSPNLKRRTNLLASDSIQTDFLMIIVFTANYKIQEFYKIPWNTIEILQRNNDNGIIYWNDQNQYRIELENLPNQDIVSLFK